MMKLGITAVLILLLIQQTAVEAANCMQCATRNYCNNYSSPQQLPQIKRKSFLWRASLERGTGVASSFEQSIFSIICDDEHITPPKDEVKKFAREIFSNYPQFLQRPSLTLGLCRTVKSSESTCHLRSSILPVDALIFGKPRVVSAKPSFICEGGEILCCVEIPIVGGLLANLSTKTADNGCLRFTWTQINNQNRQQAARIILTTEIAGNYRPALAGSQTPIPPWRSAMYCSTQRMLHAYVMWRFHGFVMDEYRRKCSVDL